MYIYIRFIMYIYIRFMDSSLVDCQVHPTFVRIVIKGKVIIPLIHILQ